MNERLRNQHTHPQRPNRRVYFAIALGIALASALGAWQWSLITRIDVAAAELRAVEARWRAVSMQAQQAKEVRPRLEAMLTRAKRIVDDRSGPRWTQALRSVVTAAGSDVELRDIHARALLDDSGSCELRIDGRTGGRSARVTADRFRETLQAHLQHSSNGKPVLTRFERLEDEPDSQATLTERAKVAFTVVATTAVDHGTPPTAGAGR